MSKIPFENLRFRIHNLPSEVPLLKEFPDLARFQELYASKVDQNKVLRFLIYLYDPKSDLIKEFADYRERKIKALKLAGYKTKDGAWEQTEASVILNGSDNPLDEAVKEEVLRMQFCMVTKVYQSRKFREWYTLQEELDENNINRMKKIESAKDDKATMEALQKKGMLRSQADEIHRLIDALEKELFGDDDIVKDYAINIRLTSPERVAAAYAGLTEED